MLTKVSKNKKRGFSHDRIRKKLQGTADRPRLNVYRSLNHIYVQVIDDLNGQTLVSASTAEGKSGVLEVTWHPRRQSEKPSPNAQRRRA